MTVRDVSPVTPSKVASIVVLPEAMLTNNPLSSEELLMVPILLLVISQLAREVISCSLSSENIPVAVNC